MTNEMLEIVDHQLYSGNLVRELRFYRPPVNAFNADLLEALAAAIKDAHDSEVGALVLSGRGGIFSAGLDIKETSQLNREGLIRTIQGMRDVLSAIGHSQIPICSAITGNCIGAGAIFSLFCDYRVMSRPYGSFGITEIKGGVTIGEHVIYALARIVGDHTAQRLIMEARILDANEAYELGLVDQVVGQQLVVSRSIAWCDRMLNIPREAMISARSASRKQLRAALSEAESESTEERVREWIERDVRSGLGKLLKK